MKKLLVLLCVFALATVANATILELSIDGATNGAGTTANTTLVVSDEITIDVYCSSHDGIAPDYWLGIEGQNPDTGEWYRSTETLYAAGPQGVVMTNGTIGDAWYYNYVQDPGTDVGEVGKWFDVVFHCTGEGELLINLYDPSGYNVIDTIAVTQIPEPMTIALLGLGGLLPRRRR